MFEEPPPVRIGSRILSVLHPLAVLVLISGSVWAAVSTYQSYSGIKQRRLAWQAANPEHYQRLLDEAAAKKAEASAKGRVKYAVSALDPNAGKTHAIQSAAPTDAATPPK
jgi:hypothetical protein